MQLDISADEALVLDEVLDRALGDTREEIYKTEAAEFKALLKRREAAIISLLERLHTRPSVT
jgi:hypothetical protein